VNDELDRKAAVCIIGAGPAGLATARALQAKGLDYDQFERQHDVGGLWDIDAPGSPMYEAAHFISSRTMSGFGGFPMGDDLPDYPSHRQVLRYLRDFADAYDLRSRITFDTPIDEVTRLDDGTWRVVRQDGQAGRYRAVISMRRGYWFIPKHVFGVPSDVFAESGPTLPAWLQQRVFGVLLNLLYGKPEKLGLQKPDHKIFETHPVLNSNLFLSLQHGDVTAKPGISTTAGRTVTFVDGSTEDFDLIIYATGYLHTVPYARRYFPGDQLPDLYLTTFSREHPGLHGVGYLETNSGAYQHFDASAQMIASHLDDQNRRPDRAREFAAMIVADRPDLSGGITFDKSPRHHGYVDAHALTHYRDSVFQRMNWDRMERTPMIDRAAGRTSAGARQVNR
jgi:cation diffusion facilitator CzcD-associated flavoprotein CzcO